MSLIIKGIDLPKDANIVIGVANDENFKMYFSGTNAFQVIQIPKGHGRIGDLDELQVNVTKAMAYGDALHEVKHHPAILESEEEE